MFTVVTATCFEDLHYKCPLFSALFYYNRWLFGHDSLICLCLSFHGSNNVLCSGEVTNIPGKMLADQFGMAGLVTYLRTVDNPSIVSLALGYDLTTLGLNLNLSE